MHELSIKTNDSDVHEWSDGTGVYQCSIVHPGSQKCGGGSF